MLSLESAQSQSSSALPQLDPATTVQYVKHLSLSTQSAMSLNATSVASNLQPRQSVMSTSQNRSRQSTTNIPNNLPFPHFAPMSETTQQTQQNHRASNFAPNCNLHFFPPYRFSDLSSSFNGKSNYNLSPVCPLTLAVPGNVNNQTGNEFMHKIAPLSSADLFTTTAAAADQHHYHRPNGINYRKLNKQDYRHNNCTVDNLPAVVAAACAAIQSLHRASSLGRTGQVKLKLIQAIASELPVNMSREIGFQRKLRAKASNSEFNLKSHRSLLGRIHRRRLTWNVHHRIRLPHHPLSSSRPSTDISCPVASNQLPTSMDNLQFNSSVDSRVSSGRLSLPAPTSLNGLHPATHRRRASFPWSFGGLCFASSSLRAPISSSIDSMPCPSPSSSRVRLSHGESASASFSFFLPKHEQIWKTNLVCNKVRSTSSPPNGHHRRHDGEFITSTNAGAVQAKITVRTAATDTIDSRTGAGSDTKRWMHRIGQPDEQFDKSFHGHYTAGRSRASYLAALADDTFSFKSPGTGTLSRRKYVDSKIDNDTKRTVVDVATVAHSSDNDCCWRDEELRRAVQGTGVGGKARRIGNLRLNLNNEVDEKIEYNGKAQVVQKWEAAPTSCSPEQTGKQLFNLSSQLSGRLPMSLSTVASNPLLSAALVCLLKSTHSAHAANASHRPFASLCLSLLLLLSSASFHRTTFAMAGTATVSPGSDHHSRQSTANSKLPFSATDFAHSFSKPTSWRSHGEYFPHPSISIMNDANHRSERNVKSAAVGSRASQPSSTDFLTGNEQHSIDELLSADLFDDIWWLLSPVHGPQPADDDRYQKTQHRWTCASSASVLDIVGGWKNETIPGCLCWLRLTSNYPVSTVNRKIKQVETKSPFTKSLPLDPNDSQTILDQANEPKRTNKKWLKKLNLSAFQRSTKATDKRLCAAIESDSAVQQQLTTALRRLHFVGGKLLETIAKEAQFDIKMDLDLLSLARGHRQPTVSLQSSSALTSEALITADGARDDLTNINLQRKAIRIEEANAAGAVSGAAQSTVQPAEHSINGRTVTTVTAAQFKVPPNGPNSPIEVSEGRADKDDEKANGTSEAVNVALVETAKTARNASSQTVNDDERNRGNATNGERWQRDRERPADNGTRVKRPNDYYDYDAEMKTQKVALLRDDCHETKGNQSVAAERNSCEQLKNCLSLLRQPLVMMIYVNDELRRRAPAATERVDMNESNRYYQTNDAYPSRQSPRGENIQSQVEQQRTWQKVAAAWKILQQRLSKCSPSPKSRCTCRVIESEKLRLPVKEKELPGKELPEKTANANEATTELKILVCFQKAADAADSTKPRAAGDGKARTTGLETNVDSDLLSVRLLLKPIQARLVNRNNEAAADEAKRQNDSGNNSSIPSWTEQAMSTAASSTLPDGSATQSVTLATSAVSSLADRLGDNQQKQHDGGLTRQQSKRNPDSAPSWMANWLATEEQRENLSSPKESEAVSATVHPVSSRSEQSFESKRKVKHHQRVRQENGSLLLSTPSVDGTPTIDLLQNAEMSASMEEEEAITLKGNSGSSEAAKHKWPLKKQVASRASKLVIEPIEIDRLQWAKSMNKSSTNVNRQLKATAGGGVDSAISSRSMRVKRTATTPTAGSNGNSGADRNGNATQSNAEIDGARTNGSLGSQPLNIAPTASLAAAPVNVTLHINKNICNDSNESANVLHPVPANSVMHQIKATESDSSAIENNDVNWPVASTATLPSIVTARANFGAIMSAKLSVSSTLVDISSRSATATSSSAILDQTLLKSHSTNLVASVNRLPQDILQQPSLGSSSFNADSNFTWSTPNNNESFIWANSPTVSAAPSASEFLPSPAVELSQSLSSSTATAITASSVNKQTKQSQSRERLNLSLNNLTRPTLPRPTTTSGKSNAEVARANDSKRRPELQRRHQQPNNDQQSGILLDVSIATTANCTKSENVELLLNTPMRAKGDKKLVTLAGANLYPILGRLQPTAVSNAAAAPTATDMRIINDDLNANNNKQSEMGREAAEAAGGIKLPPDYNRLNQTRKAPNNITVPASETLENYNNNATADLAGTATNNLILSAIGVNKRDGDERPVKTSESDTRGWATLGSGTWLHNQNGAKWTERRLKSNLTSVEQQEQRLALHKTAPISNMTKSWPSYKADDEPTEAQATTASLDVNDIQLGFAGVLDGTRAANNSVGGNEQQHRDSHRSPALTASDSEQEQQSSRFKVSTTSSSTWKPDEGGEATTGSIISTADTEAMTDGQPSKTTAEISSIAPTEATTAQQTEDDGPSSSGPISSSIDPLLAQFALATASERYCPAGIDRANLTWARTDAGVLALLPCQPTARYSGTVYRPCYSTGKWGATDLSDCRLRQLKELHRLVFRHVQKHLLDGLVPLAIQLQHLLLQNPIVSLHSPLDRIDALAALHSILANSKIEIRIDSDQEEERRTIQFVQALVLISEHLLIGSKSVQFSVDSNEQNTLLIGQLVETLHGFRVTMENLLRALILSCQDGSIKTLLLQPTPLLPQTLHFMEINLSHRKPSSSSLTPLATSKLSGAINQSNSENSFEKPKLSINFQNFSNVGIGVVEIWVHSMEASLDNGSNRLMSDLLVVSILPAVSIEVDFEVAPKFEVLLPLHGDVGQQEHSELPPTKAHREAELNELQREVAKSKKAGNEVDQSAEDDNEDEESELRQDYGWSSNKQNTKLPVKPQTEQKVKIGCGRMLTTAHGTTFWTSKGCQTATLSARYLKCICSEPGIIAAVTFPVLELPTETFENGQITNRQLGDSKIHIVDMDVSLNPEIVKTTTANLATTNFVAHRHFLYSNHLKRRLSSYDITLYISLILSVIFMLATLVIQFRLRKYETRETFFIVRNLVLTLLLIQLTFLFGTTFHMDLFWIRVAQLSPSLETPTFYRMKHILCLSVPIFLHFIHLASLFWMLSHSILLYQRFWRPIILPEVTHPGTENTQNCAKHAKVTPKSKRLKSHDFLSANENQLSSTSKECRRRYLKQIKSKSILRKKKLNKFKVVRLLNTFYSILVVPLGKISSMIKSISFVANLTAKNGSNSADKSADSCELQMENIRTSQTNEANRSGGPGLQPHHLNQCQHLSTEKVDLPTAKEQHQLSNESNEMQEVAVKSQAGQLPFSSCFTCTWKCQHFISLSMGLPFILVLLSYLLNKKGYETKRYCWMSIEGGIQYSFIIPVLILITTNTLLMLLVLKRYFERKPLTHRVHLDQIRPSLRASIILLPFFSFNWFLSVLSLETLTTSPFELIFAMTNCGHSFLVFYFHCYQRYNIHYFIKVRWARLHLKRRITKLFYRLISAINVRWCPARGSAISRSSSFNWSDFGQNENFKDDSSSAPEQQRVESAQSPADYPKHNHQHYHPPAPIEYKCNNSGLYCNHCYCNSCSTAYQAEMAPKESVHSSFYCNCSQNADANEYAKTMVKSVDCYPNQHCSGHTLNDQQLFVNYPNVSFQQHACADYSDAMPNDVHCLRNSFNVSHSFDNQLKDHYLSEKSQAMFEQTYPGEDDEEVVIVELDEDEDDIIDGSDDEEEESDEVVDDDDEDMEDLANSLNLNDFFRKNY